MKHHFLAIPLLFCIFSFLFLLSNNIWAATCNSQDGTCRVILTCAGGPPIPADDCGLTERCCPNTGLCSSQDGHCETVLTCANGYPIPADDCGLTERCCPNTNTGPVSDNKFCNGLDETGGINTALGCINVGSGNELVNTILRLALGLGGGLALALILYGVFIVTTSAGMPDKLKAGSEIITSAVIGLIFILLSVFLVHLIGINILGIPGLSL